jgi:hypothetical protein
LSFVCTISYRCVVSSTFPFLSRACRHGQDVARHLSIPHNSYIIITYHMRFVCSRYRDHLHSYRLARIIIILPMCQGCCSSWLDCGGRPCSVLLSYIAWAIRGIVVRLVYLSLACPYLVVTVTPNPPSQAIKVKVGRDGGEGNVPWRSHCFRRHSY